MGKDTHPKQIIDDAVKTFGKQSQITMFFEEAAELQNVLAKDLRGRNVPMKDIATEIVDVQIMLFQLIRIYGDEMEDMINEEFDAKLDRLAERIAEAKEKDKEN